MTYLHFYLVTRVLEFLLTSFYLRNTNVSKESRQITTWLFAFSLVPVGFELMIMFFIPLLLITFFIPLLLITLIWEFIENNIQYPIKWLYKILNGKPHDA